MRCPVKLGMTAGHLTTLEVDMTIVVIGNAPTFTWTSDKMRITKLCVPAGQVYIPNLHPTEIHLWSARSPQTIKMTRNNNVLGLMWEIAVWFPSALMFPKKIHSWRSTSFQIKGTMCRFPKTSQRFIFHLPKDSSLSVFTYCHEIWAATERDQGHQNEILCRVPSITRLQCLTVTRWGASESNH